MKREIKFRMWNVSQMIYAPNHLNSNLEPYITLHGLYYVNGIHQKDMVLMQYTGLYDKNGKEIYEGDIIKYRQHYFNINSETQLAYPLKTKEVKWNYDRWNVFETNAGESEIEVIGNIYENPELLEI